MKKSKERIQLDAGEYFSETYGKIKYAWHTNNEGNYWVGWIPSNVLPIDLFKHGLSIINNLMENHPELHNEMMNLLISYKFTGKK